MKIPYYPLRLDLKNPGLFLQALNEDLRSLDRGNSVTGSGWGWSGTSPGAVEFQDYDAPYRINIVVDYYGDTTNYGVNWSWEEITTLHGQRAVIRDNAAVDGGPYPVMLVYQGELATTLQGDAADAPYGSWKYKGIRSLDGSVVITEPEETVYAGEAEEFTGYAFIDFSISGTLSGYVPTSTAIYTNAPLTGGGNLSGDRTHKLAASAANKLLYSTALDTWAEADISAFGRSLLDDAAATNGRDTLGASSGVWPATLGGTGQSSFTVGDLLYASTTTALSKLAAGTSGYVLTSGGAGVAPSWAAASAGVTGSGTTGKLPKWSGATALSDSVLIEDTSRIGVNCTPARALEVRSTSAQIRASYSATVYGELGVNSSGQTYIDTTGTAGAGDCYANVPTGASWGVYVSPAWRFRVTSTSFSSAVPFTLTGTVGGPGGTARYLGTAAASDTWWANVPTGGKHYWAINDSALGRWDASGLSIGAGVNAAARALEVRSTSAQIRASYDATFYWERGCASDGANKWVTNSTSVGTTELEATRTITGAVTDGYAAGLLLDPGYSGAFTVTRHNYLDCQDVSLAASAVLTDACLVRFDAAAGTHKATVGATTKATPGGVDAWVKININGTLYYVPAYTSTTA